MDVYHVDPSTPQVSEQPSSAVSDIHETPRSPSTDSGSTSTSTKFINVDFSFDSRSTPIENDTSTLATKKKKTTKKDTVKKTATDGKTRSSNRGERMTFELDDVIRKYTPEQFKTCQAYDVGGVNILNKKPVDSKTALDKIKRRRETHNRVERRRRDCINQLIDELTALLPREENSESKCHRVNILRATVAHIQNLTRQNENLKHQIEALQTGKPMPPPAIITTLAPILDVDEDEDFDDNRSFNSETSAAAPYTLPSNLPASIVNLSLEKSPSSYHAPPHEHEPLSPSMQPHGIPMIVEPLDNAPRNDGPNSKRLNRQTLPRLQLVPPPFHHHQHQHQHHRRSNSAGTGPHSPSFYGQDSSTSPSSAYSGYSSSTAPWSSPGPYSGSLSATSSGYGYGSGTSPRSPSFSNHGPPSPYSPYEPSSAHAYMSRSPVLAPWSAAPPSSGQPGSGASYDEEMTAQRQPQQHQPWPSG
ncbi:hypothetical protein BGZ80_004307 [Entomortierella chlamydospora]|uniref:BHLH domain-containing protein n=1 Tax=Entomortierella chlamydospora TaxID=101097 RepID=A0A9P6SVZ8_9FUNG|nr:hypothetical protein BGZ80_004307 [Entomortierella chlamydospora]